MFEYEVILPRYEPIKFISFFHILNLEIHHVNGARMVFFPDKEIAINLNHVIQMKINNEIFHLALLNQ